MTIFSLQLSGTIKEIQKLPKKAKIEAINKDFDGNVGSTTVIEVKVVGDPMPTARWYGYYFNVLKIFHISCLNRTQDIRLFSQLARDSCLRNGDGTLKSSCSDRRGGGEG